MEREQEMMKEYYYNTIFLDGYWRILIVQKGYWDENKKFPKECDQSIVQEMFSRGFFQTSEFVFTLRIKTHDTGLKKLCNKFGLVLKEELNFEEETNHTR